MILLITTTINWIALLKYYRGKEIQITKNEEKIEVKLINIKEDRKRMFMFKTKSQLNRNLF